jgi:hypothetical protein
LIPFITALTLSVVVSVSTIGGFQDKPGVNDTGRVMADFKARVDKYVELRKKADDTAQPLKKTEESEDIRTAQQMLVERIGLARSGARQGDIFTPEIAAHFRRIIRPESREQGTKEAIKEDKAVNVPFKVNGPYPDKQPLATMPPNVLAALPALPKDIDYRFVDKHLILRDLRANLIIDYMLNVIP